jgi:enoyl-CoA hydratase
MSSPPATTRVELDVTDGAAWITLDGPRTRNALDEDSAAALAAACDRIDADPSIGVAVITGTHGAFCSGAARGFVAGLADEPAHVGYERTSATSGSARCTGRSTASAG